MIVNRAALEAALDALGAVEGQFGDTKTVINDAKEFIGAFDSEIKAQSGGVKTPGKSVGCHQATIKGEC